MKELKGNDNLVVRSGGRVTLRFDEIRACLEVLAIGRDEPIGCHDNFLSPVTVQTVALPRQAGHRCFYQIFETFGVAD